MMDDERRQTGNAIRERMWGTEAGEAKLARATEFQRDFEELVTSYCFGAVWGREGLSQAERSMLTIGMLVALGKPDQLAVHVEGAVANGVTRDQIREVLLHSAPYCGIPAALTAFRVAEPVLDRMGAA
jgi:4-carboxymuconolactone decarboxylase